MHIFKTHCLKYFVSGYFFVTRVRNNNVSDNCHLEGWMVNLQFVDIAVT